MKNPLKLILLVTICAFSSCDKDDDSVCVSEPEKEQWERFVGDYLVYDTLGNFSHEMSISHFYSDSEGNGVGTDSVLIENYADKFNLRFKFNYTTDRNYLSIPPFNPIQDYDGFSWYYWSNNEIPDNSYQDNYKSNDTIYLSYTLDNTPYWVQDGVEFYSCECREIAVKQD